MNLSGIGGICKALGEFARHWGNLLVFLGSCPLPLSLSPTCNHKYLSTLCCARLWVMSGGRGNSIYTIYGLYLRN